MQSNVGEFWNVRLGFNRKATIANLPKMALANRRLDLQRLPRLPESLPPCLPASLPADFYLQHPESRIRRKSINTSVLPNSTRNTFDFSHPATGFQTPKFYSSHPVSRILPNLGGFNDLQNSTRHTLSISTAWARCRMAAVAVAIPQQEQPKQGAASRPSGFQLCLCR